MRLVVYRRLEAAPVASRGEAGLVRAVLRRRTETHDTETLAESSSRCHEQDAVAEGGDVDAMCEVPA